jgi:hypothetical protein
MRLSSADSATEPEERATEVAGGRHPPKSDAATTAPSTIEVLSFM